MDESENHRNILSPLPSLLLIKESAAHLGASRRSRVVGAGGVVRIPSPCLGIPDHHDHRPRRGGRRTRAKTVASAAVPIHATEIENGEEFGEWRRGRDRWEDESARGKYRNIRFLTRSAYAHNTRS